MTYTVHSIFYTLQGEGANAGRAAVFCRFAGCNLWTGREQDRASAACKFCDTEFRGGEKYRSPQDLAWAIWGAWPSEHRPRFVVFTGGEPLLQLDARLVELCRGAAGFQVAVETNGTLPPVRGIDWLTVSPKAGARTVVARCDELKLVYPQDEAPGAYDGIEAAHRFLQPMDGPDLEANTRAAAEFCLGDPRWRLSLQTHKIVGLP